MDETFPGRAAVPPLAPSDPLPGWGRSRETGLRLLAEVWTVTAAVSIVLALQWERCAVVPVLFTVVSGGTWLGGVVRTAWWRRRRRTAGHPMVRAAVGRRTARGRPQPHGWAEPFVVGALHVTEHGWRWVPSRWCADEVSTRDWPHTEIAGLTYLPSWGPGLPRAGYLRPFRTTGGPVDLLVWDPELVGLLEPLPDDARTPVTGSGP